MRIYLLILTVMRGDTLIGMFGFVMHSKMAAVPACIKVAASCNSIGDLR